MSSSFRSSVDIDARKIHEYSRSPHGLSERQLSEVRDLVLSVQDDLGWYDDEICRLESQLLQLKSRRERARKSQQSLRSLLSPIHRLPNELLIRIFVYVCQDISALPTFGLSVGPFYVSAVCARWRLLALSSSKLWSNFWVRIRSGSSQKLEEAVVLCLQRSKHQPLTLTLYVQSSESHSLFRTLFDYSIRWQRVMLFLDSEAARFFNGQEGFDFPALESVTVAANYHDVPVNLDIFIRAPKLHTLWPTNANIELNSVVLHQITDLMYNLSTGNHLHELLNLTPQLRTLTLTEAPLGEEPDSPFPELPIVIPRLASLSVSYNYAANVTPGGVIWCALRSLTIPSLTTLSLNQMFYSRSAEITQVYSQESFNVIDLFLTRSNCSLTKLDLEAVFLTDKHIVALLKRLPSLEELTVTDFIIDDEDPDEIELPITEALIQSLHSYECSALRSSSWPILPKLQSLSLVVRSTGFNHSAFIEVISSRWNPDEAFASKIGVACIRNVNLAVPDPVDQAEYLPLLRLRKLGLSLSVEGKDPAE